MKVASVNSVHSIKIQNVKRNLRKSTDSTPLTTFRGNSKDSFNVVKYKLRELSTSLNYETIRNYILRNRLYKEPDNKVPAKILV